MFNRVAAAAQSLGRELAIVEIPQEERGSRPNIVYPSAPRIRLRELPLEDEAIHHQQMVNISDGSNQLLPPILLFRNNLLPRIDARLAFQERARAVVRPTITFMPEFPEYLWAAVGAQVTRRDDVRVHFEEIADAATDPPVSSMRMTTEFGGWIVIDSREGTPYVTVADVQKAVIRWMKETRTRPSSRERAVRFSSWVRVTDDNGTELEVEVWVWRGLTPLPGNIENWALHLCKV